MLNWDGKSNAMKNVISTTQQCTRSIPPDIFIYHNLRAAHGKCIVELWPHRRFSNSTWAALVCFSPDDLKKAVFPYLAVSRGSDLITAWITNLCGSSSNEFGDFLSYCVTLEMLLHLIAHLVAEVEYKILISRTAETEWMGI